MDLSVLERAVAARRVVDLRGLSASDLVAPYLFAEEIPAGADVLDCREAHHYAAWHYPGADRWDLADLATRFKQLDKTRRYILYCSFGVQSAYVAEAMQRAGYEAYSFKGGVRELKRYARGLGVPVPAFGEV
jgi:thiamine biosynthesis protein ThiI